MFGNRIISVCVTLLFALSTKAIEVPLLKNRAEIGTVGYVDMNLIFSKLPETQKAMQAFRQDLQKQQEIISDKEKGLYRLKSKLIKLKEERMLIESYRGSGSFPDSKQEQVALPDYDLLSSPDQEDITPAKASQSLNETSSPQVMIASPSALAPQVMVTKDAQVTTTVIGEKPKDEIISDKNRLEAKIATLTSEIQAKQIEMAELKKRTKTELNELAEIKKQKIFVKIYKTIQEVSKKEGISVVVRKKDILFGQEVVDLTQKVLDKLITQP